MVILFISNNIYHPLCAKFFISFLCSAKILCHIHRCAVTAQQEFVIQPCIREINPHRTIILLIEDTALQTILNQVLAQQVGFAFVIQLVETYAKALICILKAGIHPSVHFLPQGDGVRIMSFPFQQQVSGFATKITIGIEINVLVCLEKILFTLLCFLAFAVMRFRIACLLPQFILSRKFLFKTHIPFTDKVVALDSS